MKEEKYSHNKKETLKLMKYYANFALNKDGDFTLAQVKADALRTIMIGIIYLIENERRI
jgi:hypothetical protein